MADPSMADVLAKLDELQRAIESLRAAVVGGAGRSSTRRQSAGSPAAAAAAPLEAPAQPTEIPVAPESPAAPSPDPSPAAAARVGAGSASDAHAGEDGEPPAPRPSDGPTEVLRLLFSAALKETEEESWPHLMALTHSRDLENPRALDYLKAFNWRKLRRSLDRYLVDGDPASFHVVRTDPAEIGDAEYVKVFLHQKGGMPGPVHLQRDPKKGGAWLVSQISL